MKINQLVALFNEELNQEERATRETRAFLMQGYKPIEQEHKLNLNEDDIINDLKDLNRFLNKAGFYPLNNLSYSYDKKLCGFKTTGKKLQYAKEHNGELKTAIITYEQIISRFFKRYNKKTALNSFMNITITKKEITLSYNSISMIKTLSLKFNGLCSNPNN